ncbi:MAG: serine hydrolase [Candidatus Nomurabacteria bacterium]|nr:serine hydrolase [Candidatus Saccharibacteria bacterium]USN95766.1 MAG: serine hydrolase [Candidatus Nomurabacteria bacterium]
MPQTSYRRHTESPQKPTKSRHLRSGTVLFMAILMIAVVAWLLLAKKKAHSPSTPTNQSTNQQPTSNTNESSSQEKTLPNIQSTIDEFIKNNPGTYAIKITDINGRSLAEVNGDQQFFTASIYKLFVAYVGYQKIDDGTYDLNEPYITGYTRGECLDAMIRASYSPCAEKMWAELGKESITEQMKSYGLINTSLTGLYTSANDSAIMLQKIAKGEGLSVNSKKSYLDSMKSQDSKFRIGLPAGFTKSIVYNKVGWNEDKEWHDTAIIELPNGQKIVVAILTTGVGYKTIAQLGAKIEQALLK